MNPLSTYVKSQPLFTPSTNQRSSITESHATDELFSDAYFGNTAAITALISIAAGTDDPTGMRARVEQGLLDLYSSPNTSEHVRKEIAAQAHSFQELAQLNGSKSGSSLDLKLPFKLLYLAGRHESSRFGMSQLLKKIAHVFQDAITKMGGDFDSKILSSSRYVTAIEMTRKHAPLSVIKMHPDLLNASWPDHLNKCVNEIADSLLSNQVDAPKAMGAFLLVGDGHWIPVVFQRDGEKVRGYISDSSWGSGVRRHTPITRMMQDALGDRMSTFKYAYSELQGLTNACGLMSTRFIAALDRQLDANPATAIPDAIDNYVTEWKALSSEQRKGIVTGLRAEKLALVAESANPGSRFPSTT